MGISEEAMEELAKFFWLKYDKEAMLEEKEKIKREFQEETFISQIEDTQKQFVRKIETFLSLYKPDKAGGLFQPGFGEKLSDAVPNTECPITIEWVFNEDGEPLEEIDASSDKEPLDEADGYWILLH